MPLRELFEITVLLSTALSLLLFSSRDRLRAGKVAPPQRSAIRAVAFHPLVHFGAVCVLLLTNQVLFSTYILTAHHGDTSFIARFIPGPWFAIPRHDALVGFLAHHVGNGQWLSPSLLRVQAFLELPFTMLAYLAVARPLGRRLYAKLCRPLPLTLAAISFSISFSIVELWLRNPYTNEDLLLRAAACALTPVYLAWIARSEERHDPLAAAPSGPSGVLGLFAFLAGAGALAYVVLALYDTFLLYNLAHLPRYASGLALATLVATSASFAAPRVDAMVARAAGSTQSPSLAVGVIVSALRAFTLFFFVPSLALRYRGGQPSAVVCGFAIVLVAATVGIAAAIRRAKPTPATILRVAACGAVAIFVGFVAARFAWDASLARGAPMLPELVLARLALSFLVSAIASFRLLEIFVCWLSHETKAQADEA